MGVKLTKRQGKTYSTQSKISLGAWSLQPYEYETLRSSLCLGRSLGDHSVVLREHLRQASWVSNPAKILTVGLQSYGGENKSNSIPSTHAALPLREPHVPGLPKSRLSFRNLQLPIVRFVNLSQFL